MPNNTTGNLKQNVAAVIVDNNAVFAVINVVEVVNVAAVEIIMLSPVDQATDEKAPVPTT